MVGENTRALAAQQRPVLLLAAGKGERLRPLTDERPKAMVDVGGEPLAERALRTLRQAGFERVVAVTGHRAEALEGLDCELRFNERWEADNNVVSLWAARELVQHGCYVVNSDVIFDLGVAEALASGEDSFLLCDASQGVDEESMKAQARDGLLTRLSKHAPLDDNEGEYIGLLSVAAADGPRLAEILDDFVARGETDVYYENAIEALARERPVRVVSVAGCAWAEIDDHADLDYAEREVVARV